MIGRVPDTQAGMYGVIKRQDAQAQIERLKDSQWAPTRIVALGGVPGAATWLRAMQRTDDLSPEAQSLRAEAAAFKVTRLSDAERERLFAGLFPKLAVHMARVWESLAQATCRRSAWEPCAFRAPGDARIVARARADWFAGVFDELAGLDPDPEWLAAWGGHFHYSGIQDSALILAAVMDEPGPEGDRVFEILKDSASGRHEVGVMNDHIITAMLATQREDAWVFMEKMLLAAQRQEGLRQSILERAHTAQRGAFRRLLRLILEEDLVRFAATVRAIDVWFGFRWDSMSTGHARSIVERALALFDDPAARATAIRGKDPETVYLALWCDATQDAQAASEKAAALLGDKDPARRWVGVHALATFGRPERLPDAVMALDDSDIRVAARAVEALTTEAFREQMNRPWDPTENVDNTVDSPDAHMVEASAFDALHRLMARLPSKGETFKPLVFPWSRSKLTPADVGYTLTQYCRPEQGERLIALLDRLNATSRAAATWLIAGRRQIFIEEGKPLKRAPLSDTARGALIALLGDPAREVRVAAGAILNPEAPTPAEIARHEALIERSASDVRSRAVTRLMMLPDAGVLEVAARLLSSGKARQAAGLELLRAMADGGRAIDAVQALAQPLRDNAKKPAKNTQTALDAIFSARGGPSVRIEDALGLVTGFAPRPLPILRPGPVEFTSPAAIECLRSLDELVAKNATLEIRPHKGTVDDSGELLGGLTSLWKYTPPGPEDTACPFASILEPWLAGLGVELRDADGLELVRAWAVAVSGHKKAISAGKPGKSAFKLEYAMPVRLLLDWALYLHPPAGASEWMLDQAEAAIARGDLARGNEGGWRDYDTSQAGLSAHGWFRLHQELLSKVRRQQDAGTLERIDGLYRAASAAAALTTKPAADDDEAPRAKFVLNIDAVTTLWEAGRVGDDELLLRLANSRDHWGKQSGEDFRRLCGLRLPHRRRHETLALTPRLEALIERLRARVLEIELARGDAATPATPLANVMDPSGGVDAAVGAMAAFGDFSLVRGFIYNDKSKAATLSLIIRHSRPGPTDTPQAFADAARAAGLSERRLVELALYQPRWAAHVEHALGWAGLEEAVLWLRVHTKEAKDAFRIDEEKEAWEGRAAEFTPIPPESLADGAVDRAWFQRSYKALGPKRWEVLYDAANYASSGTGHSRARLFADAILGEVTEKELTTRVTAKRHQDAARALGLLALKPGDAGRKQVMTRFKVLQEMRRTSRTHGGSMLQASEKRAVEIGMENLAWTAGYPDPLRLQWAMEIEEFGDLAKGAVTVKVGDVSVALAVDEQGAPSLTAMKKGTALKAVPPAVKKDKKVAALQQRLTDLRRQTSRIRVALEQAMCRGDEFTGAEIPTLFGHPLLKSMLSRLVLVGTSKAGGSLIGYPDKGGKTLRQDSGVSEPLRATDSLRIAHPLDLLATKRWDAWQRECFAAERVQPFKQVFREVYIPVGPELHGDNETAPTRSTRYAGQQVQPRQALALFGSRGWVARPEEGVQRTFHRERLTVHVAFEEGFYTPAEIDGLTLAGLMFARPASYVPVPITEVPPRVFSEVMRDLDLVVSVAHRSGVDPEASQSTVELRAALLRETCSLLSLGNVAIEGPRAIIDGELGRYALHLGSGTIHTLPGGTLWIVPVHSQHRGRIFLPFADDDPKTAEVLSKALLLARDAQIQDPAILNQIRAR